MRWPFGGTGCQPGAIDSSDADGELRIGDGRWNVRVPRWHSNLLQLFVAIAPEGIPRLNQASSGLARPAVCGCGLPDVRLGVWPGARPGSDGNQSLIRTTGRLGSRGGFRQGLVATQIAISLVLLTSAGLLLRSLWNLMNVPLGMRTSNVLTASLVLGQQRYSQPAQQQAFFEQLEARLQGLARCRSTGDLGFTAACRSNQNHDLLRSST